MRQWRRRVQLWPSLLVVFVFFAGAAVVDEIIAPEACQAWVCPAVRDGSMSEWVARWIFWCDCGGPGTVMTRADSCRAPKLAVIGSHR